MNLGANLFTRRQAHEHKLHPLGSVDDPPEVPVSYSGLLDIDLVTILALFFTHSLIYPDPREESDMLDFGHLWISGHVNIYW